MIRSATTVRIDCSCGRKLADFTLDGGVLRPGLTHLEPAGPRGRRDEYRWSFPRCRCGATVVLRGDTIWSAASKALSAGRVKTVQLAGARREAVRRQVARGDTTWQRAQALADASKIVVLRIGEDL